jgi:hypothetical protein
MAKRYVQQGQVQDGVREQLKTLPGGQLSTTDPDARSMSTGSKISGAVGYNVQVAVDTKGYLIVTHEVTNDVNDKAQLIPISGLSQLQLNAIARQLNGRSRKTLGFRTPAEMFSDYVASTG